MVLLIRVRMLRRGVGLLSDKIGRNQIACLSTQTASASYVNARHAPADFDSSAAVYEEMVTIEEGDILAQEMLGRMRRRRYERGHWDAVITNYKEIELSDESSLSPTSQQIMQRIRTHLESHHLAHSPGVVRWLPCHAIDLRRDTGELKPHVDSIRFSGDLVAGLSLLSPSIMRLKPDSESSRSTNSAGWVDMYLPPLSLYVMTGMSRYEYTHELLPTDSSFEMPDGVPVEVARDQRLSIIFRDAKQQ